MGIVEHSNCGRISLQLRQGDPSPSSTATARPTGEVTLQIDTVPRHASDTMTFTLNNQTNQVIYSSDHLTECTVVLLQLERQSSGSGTWQAVAPCRREIVTRLPTLAPGKNLTVTLIPPGDQWVRGLYRVLLSYFSSGEANGLKTVSSPSFQVGA